jgi:hypothetical protein
LVIAARGRPDSLSKQIVSSCSSQPGATKSECEYALGQIEKTITYDEFLKADAALRRDANATTDVQDELDAAVNACAGK